MKVALHNMTVMIQFALEAIVKGYSNDDLLALLVKDYPKESVEDIKSIIRRAHLRLHEVVLTDVDKIIPIHIQIYEQIYKEMDELYCVQGKLRALRQKENLVGIHKETNTLEIHNTVNVEIETEQKYNLEKLDDKEQKRFQLLLKKALSK